MEKRNFESYLEKKNDRIDNAAQELILAILDKDPNGSNPESVFPWNMEVIGQVTDLVESILAQRSLPTCHPYYGDDGFGRTPCFECADCANADCPFKKA